MAPKGNKNAVGNGRPPKEGYTDGELILLGTELLAWMKACDEDKKCDVVHLSEWYSEIKDICPKYWKDSICKRPCFSAYYEKAMKWMGKRILKNKKLAPSYGNRFLPIYFREINESEWESRKAEIDYEHEKKQAMAYDPEVYARFMGVMDSFSKSQQKTPSKQDVT